MPSCLVSEPRIQKTTDDWGVDVTFTKDEIARAEALGLGPYRRYGIKEAATLLGVEYSLARRMISSGELGAIRVGKRAFVLGGHIAQSHHSIPTALATTTSLPAPVGGPVRLG